MKPETVGLSGSQLARIDDAVKDAIEHHETPGAVVLVGHRGRIVFRKAYGNRSLEPEVRPMLVSTVFDMASLTKVVATATSMMILLERGKYRLDDPASKYLPEFAPPRKDSATSGRPANVAWDPQDKSHITLRQLMTHLSGLKPDFDLSQKWTGYAEAIRHLGDETLQARPGTKFTYSDLNYIALGEIVHRLSGEPLDQFSEQNIFKPLGMRDTSFTPGEPHRERAAPTERRSGTESYLGGSPATSGPNEFRQGEVHDPTAWRMGGVAGHAGLFSTADDLAVFCQMILNHGEFSGVRILSPLGVKTMTTNQVPAALSHDAPSDSHVARGIGWDIVSSYSSNRGDLLPPNSFGHTGFTGTSLWIDPSTQTFVIILTNRVHPNGKGNVTALRARIANIVAASIQEIR
ncbi:MAG: serine hydrolase [Acidobacteriia bacterium]|nr:serine hydrolase [Terriglobia bacterium]